MTAGGQLESRERVDRHRVRVDPADVAQDDAGIAVLEQRADAPAQPRQVGSADGAAKANSSVRASRAIRASTAASNAIHRRRGDEFGPARVQHSDIARRSAKEPTDDRCRHPYPLARAIVLCLGDLTIVLDVTIVGGAAVHPGDLGFRGVARLGRTPTC